jgi:hypothetical protein
VNKGINGEKYRITTTGKTKKKVKSAIEQWTTQSYRPTAPIF